MPTPPSGFLIWTKGNVSQSSQAHRQISLLKSFHQIERKLFEGINECEDGKNYSQWNIDSKECCQNIATVRRGVKKKNQQSERTEH